MTKEVYYITQEQLYLIKDLKEGNWPLARLVDSDNVFRPLNKDLTSIGEKAVFRYLGGDETIEFKVKEQLYRLVRIDDDGDSVYMKFGIAGTPTYTSREDDTFTATLEEIKKWKTPAWDIEDVDYED